MKWKYAPVAEIDADGNEVWTVGEVYKDNNSDMGFTTHENPSGSTLVALIKDLETMLEDVKRTPPIRVEY